jgi:cytoskeletal protein CcmA (bactofilin family)
MKSLVRRSFLTFALLLLNLFIGTAPAFAQTEPPVHNGPFFAADDTVIVEQAINGPVFAAGGMVEIRGAVSQDVVVAGGTVRVTGDVEQDIYAAGGSVLIEGTVQGNVVVAGGEVQILPSAQVNGVVLAAGERVSVNGTAQGPIYLGGSLVRLNGSVVNDTYIGGERLELGEQASLGGSLFAQVEEDAVIDSQASISGDRQVDKLEQPADSTESKVIGKIGRVLYSIAWRFALTAGLLFFFPVMWSKAVERFDTSAARHFLTGVVLLIGLPFLGVALLATFIGIPLTVLLFLLYVIGLMLAWLVPSLWVGWKILPTQNVYWQALTGISVIAVLSAIPLLGVFLLLVVATLGLGSLYAMITDQAAKVKS